MRVMPDELKAAANELRNGRVPPSVTVRKFLSWFGVERRGYSIVSRIRFSLAHIGVRTLPDFESAYIDSYIDLRLEKEPSTDSTQSKGAEAPESSQPAYLGGALSDATYRIGKLDSANKDLEGVSPDCLLTEAITKMLLNDYSQLPVWQSPRSVKGMISWASIGAHTAFNKPTSIVRDCMEQHHIVSADASLFAALPTIIAHQYVLVADKDGSVTGIVTTSDLSMQFQKLTEPFLLIGEIENHIRRIINEKFTAQELAAALKWDESDGEPTSVADLTLGDCVRLLERPDHWKRIGLPVDRTTFVKSLDKIRTIRNDVMHFDPDGPGEDALHVLRKVVGFLQKLCSIGAV